MSKYDTVYFAIYNSSAHEQNHDSLDAWTWLVLCMFYIAIFNHDTSLNVFKYNHFRDMYIHFKYVTKVYRLQHDNPTNKWSPKRFKLQFWTD